MARKNQSGHTIAEVYLWGHRVGAVLWNQQRQLGAFEYDPEFCRLGLEIAPLTMPAIPDEVYFFPSLPRDTFKGLPGLLADSLPDKFGNALIDAWLARNGMSAQDFTPVDRLLYTGSRAMGALEYRPAMSHNGAGRSEKVQLDSLVDLAAKVLQDREALAASLTVDGNGAEDKALHHLFQVGTSAGGARPKAVIAMNANGEIRSGQVEAPAGYQYWLLKFDIPKDATSLGDPAGFGRVEYAYSRMAVEAGVTMTECRLHEEGGRAHFMTRRFDRTDDGDRLHVQTLCALAHADFNVPGGFSYEETLMEMRTLGLPREDMIQLFTRMVFNVIARNQDDHTKNISFLMDRGGAWRLAPAYDVAWAYRPDSEWVSTHQMTINGKRDDFSLDDLRAVASQIPNFKPDPVIEQVKATVSRWLHYADAAGVDEELTEQIAVSHRLELQ